MRQTSNLFDHRVDVQRRLRWRGLFEEGADMLDDVRRRIAVPDNTLYRRLRSREVRAVAA